ncbi:MAG: hypothetical protein GX774_06940 [Armatimonadetes bacterium]|nr:hypothetical protein [Armatimonadota bacterium]
MRRLLPRVSAAVLLTTVCLWLPSPGIPGACVSAKNALLVLVAILYLGKTLYDTLFAPRPRP